MERALDGVKARGAQETELETRALESKNWKMTSTGCGPRLPTTGGT